MNSHAPILKNEALRLSFMYSSVLALVLLPLVNNVDHLNNLLRTSTDPDDRKEIYHRLLYFQVSLITIALATILVVALIPIQILNPYTRWTVIIFIVASILLCISLCFLVIDVTVATYIASPIYKLLHTKN